MSKRLSTAQSTTSQPNPTPPNPPPQETQWVEQMMAITNPNGVIQDDRVKTLLLCSRALNLQHKFVEQIARDQGVSEQMFVLAMETKNIEIATLRQQLAESLDEQHRLSQRVGQLEQALEKSSQKFSNLANKIKAKKMQKQAQEDKSPSSPSSSSSQPANMGNSMLAPWLVP
eukprot:c23883_g1_i1.p1 GENE.c23883_g1_i1~~c23883_g1_i1.p1  ORF type:complete len:182 (+),score=45.02 c23883_g1_i1:31-546(+)